MRTNRFRDDRLTTMNCLRIRVGCRTQKEIGVAAFGTCSVDKFMRRAELSVPHVLFRRADIATPADAAWCVLARIVVFRRRGHLQESRSGRAACSKAIVKGDQLHY